jgi:hypothetical protein
MVMIRIRADMMRPLLGGGVVCERQGSVSGWQGGMCTRKVKGRQGLELVVGFPR